MAYSPDVTRLPEYRQKHLDAQLPGYDSPTTLHDTVADWSTDPLTMMLEAEKREAEDSIWS